MGTRTAPRSALGAGNLRHHRRTAALVFGSALAYSAAIFGASPSSCSTQRPTTQRATTQRAATQRAAPVTQPSAYDPAGDVARGKTLSISCEACHVDAAVAIGVPPVHAPRLQHQRPSSIFYALQDYKAKRRASVLMQPMAATLSDQDMRDLSAYLAGSRLAEPPHALPSEAHERASSICGFCHGETGLGVMDGVPILAGQHSDYLEKALADYRSGARTNPTMTVIAKELTTQQSHELVAYFAQYPALESIP